jgi:hypothetical protein
VQGFEPLIEDIDAEGPHQGVGQNGRQPRLFAGGQFGPIDLLQSGGKDFDHVPRREVLGQCHARRAVKHLGRFQAAVGVIEDRLRRPHAVGVAAAGTSNVDEDIDGFTRRGVDLGDGRFGEFPLGLAEGRSEVGLVEPAMDRPSADPDFVGGLGNRPRREECSGRGLLDGGDRLALPLLSDQGGGAFGVGEHRGIVVDLGGLGGFRPVRFEDEPADVPYQVDPPAVA